jgi:hypothetical protein
MTWLTDAILHLAGLWALVVMFALLALEASTRLFERDRGCDVRQVGQRLREVAE